jgi:O-antigen/teichoic acid export membrane protein/aminoglycoside phosphotransferase
MAPVSAQRQGAAPAAGSAPARAGARGRKRRLLRDPLVRNGHALNVSTALSSLVGLGFWLLVARRYDAAAVGRNAAAISGLMFIGGVSQLNLASALVRFVPVAGASTRRLILGVYATGASVAIVLGAAFLALVPRLVPELDFLVDNPLMACWFVLSCATWAVFALEDGALTGLRRMGWVPFENGAFSLAKVAAVLGLAALLPSSGILVAWTGCTLLTVVPTNLLIFTRAVPAHMRRLAPQEPPASQAPLIAQLLGYVPFDCVGSLCWLAATSLVPVFVIARVGGRQAAVLNLCWVISYSMYLASINLGSALVVDTAGGPSSIAKKVAAVRRHLWKLLVPACIVVALCSKPLLALFGGQYERGGAGLLAVLALSSLPFVFNATAVSAFRSRRQTRHVAAINAALLFAVALVTWILLPTRGVLAVGLGWLAAQCSVAVALFAVERRARPRLASAARPPAGPPGRIAVPPGDGERAALPPRGATARPAPAPPAAAGRRRPQGARREGGRPGRLRATGAVLSLCAARLAARVPAPRRLLELGARRDRAEALRLVEGLLADVDRFLEAAGAPADASGATSVGGVAPAPGRGCDAAAREGRASRRPGAGRVTLRRGGSDRAVAQISLDGSSSRVLIKIARSATGVSELQREREALDALHDEQRLGDWRRLLPRWEPGGSTGDDYVLERVLPGVDAAALLRSDPRRAGEVAVLGLAAIGTLHDRTAEPVLVEARHVARWLEDPLALITTMHPSGHVPDFQHRAARLLERRLTEAVLGSTLPLAWTHGDYTPGNVLVDVQRSAVSGIVDWAQAEPGRLPDLDRTLWLMTIECQVSGLQLGSLVSRVLRDGSTGRARTGRARTGRARTGTGRDAQAPHRRWPALGSLLDGPAVGPAPCAPTIDLTDAVLWAWLDHVAGNLAKSARYVNNSLWWMSNVEPVLRTVCEQSGHHATLAGPPTPEEAPGECGAGPIGSSVRGTAITSSE